VGSVFRVAGRIVSSPALVGVYVVLTIGMLFEGPEDIYSESGPLWRPARASYHFKDDLRELRFSKGGEIVPSFDGECPCSKSEVVMARKAEQKPRLRTIRGCWCAYRYPVAAFEPGIPTEVELIERGRKERTRRVPLPDDLIRRIRSDYEPAEDRPDEKPDASDAAGE
jgi:hypothetical protein